MTCHECGKNLHEKAEPGEFCPGCFVCAECKFRCRYHETDPPVLGICDNCYSGGFEKEY